MANAQDYVNEKHKDKTVKKLHINENNLKGELNLSEFADLIELDCSGNQLTILDLSGNTKLREIDCSCNHLQLIKINLPSTLEYLNLLNNRFPEQDLSFFKEFVNLKKLFIGNDNEIDDEKIHQNSYNQFNGDLEFLKDLKNLEFLDINNTNIIGGLEYLPDSVKTLRCSSNEGLETEFKVKKIYKQLETFAIDDKDALTGRYNLRGWKENWKLSKENESLQELKKENESLKEQIDELNKESMSSENEELNIQLAELKERENVLLAAQKDLKTEVENLKLQKNHLESELEKTTDIYQQTKKELEEKVKVLETFTITNEPTQEILQLQNDIKDLSDTLSAKKKDEELHREKLEKVDKKLEDKEEKIRSLEIQLTGIVSSIGEIHTKQKDLVRTKDEFAKELRFGKGSTANLRKRMDGLKEQIKLKTKERDGQINEAKRVKEELGEVRKNRKILQEEKSQLEAFLNKVKVDKQNFEEKLGFVYQQIGQQIDGLISQIQIKEEKLEEFKDNIRNKDGIRERTLREILDKQKKFIESDGSVSDEDLAKRKQKLVNEGLDNEKVEKLLNMQEEVIRLEMLKMQLESFIPS